MSPILNLSQGFQEAGCITRYSTHLWRNNMKQRYTTQTSLRLSEDLRTSIDTVCDAYNVNPSDYIRTVVAINVQSALTQIQNGDTKIVFVCPPRCDARIYRVRNPRFSLLNGDFCISGTNQKKTKIKVVPLSSVSDFYRSKI